MFDSFCPYNNGIWCNTVAQQNLGLFVWVQIPLSQLFIITMSKGKKFNTPKRFWNKMKKKTKRPWYSTQSWRKTNPHVFGRNHNKFKWFYRNKKWFKSFEGNHISHQKMNKMELWFWD